MTTKLTIWTTTADLDTGFTTSIHFSEVHYSEAEAYKEAMLFVVWDIDTDDEAKAEAFLAAEDYQGLDDLIHDNLNPLDSLSVEKHEINLDPTD